MCCEETLQVSHTHRWSEMQKKTKNKKTHRKDNMVMVTLQQLTVKKILAACSCQQSKGQSTLAFASFRGAQNVRLPVRYKLAKETQARWKRY